MKFVTVIFFTFLFLEFECVPYLNWRRSYHISNYKHFLFSGFIW